VEMTARSKHVDLAIYKCTHHLKDRGKAFASFLKTREILVKGKVAGGIRRREG
jgi:hypothetical protein